MPTPVRTDATDMDFYDALKQIVAGKKVTRQDWQNEDCVFLHAGAVHLRKTDGSLHTLIVSDGDIAATDWALVREQ